MSRIDANRSAAAQRLDEIETAVKEVLDRQPDTPRQSEMLKLLGYMPELCAELRVAWAALEVVTDSQDEAARFVANVALGRYVASASLQGAKHDPHQ